MRVLDLSRTIAGGYCAEMLRLIGAEVVRPAIAATALPPIEDDPLVVDYVNRGKTLLEEPIDLDTDRKPLLALIAQSDCVVEDWGPGRLDAIGVDEATLRERAPALVLTRLSEFGLDGPWAGRAGSELIDLAAGGMLFLTGSWERPPVQLAPYQAQLTAGLLAAVAAAAALYGGGPATIELSKQEAVLALVTPALTEYVYSGTIQAREGQVAAMARIERAADTWVYAGPGAAATADYQAYAAFLGIPEFAEERFATPDRRMENWPEHQELLSKRLRERTARAWVDDAAANRLTFGLVQTTTDLLADAVLTERRFFAETEVDGKPARAPAAPYLIDGERPEALARPAAVETNERRGS